MVHDEKTSSTFWGRLRRFRGEITLIGILGVTAGAISLFNLANTFIEFGLAKVLRDILSYYQFFTAFLFGWIDYFLGVRIPQALKDIWILSFLGVALEYRSRAQMGSHWVIFRGPGLRGYLRALTHPILFHIGRIIRGFLMVGITYFGFALYFSWMLRPSQRRKFFGDEHADIPWLPSPQETPLEVIMINRNRFLKEAGKTLIVLIFFFALNAYAPSV